MPEVLDQTEVDALLGAIDSGGIQENETREHGPVEEKREVTIYDFKRPERVSKEQLRAITALHEDFARNFGAALSGFMRTIVEVELASVEQLTYSQFILSLPNPTCFALLQADKLDGALVLEINPTVLFPIIDRLLGGGKTGVTIPERPLTNIEFRLAGKIIQLALEQLDQMWSRVLDDVSFSVERMEFNPHLVQIVPANEPVVLAAFEVSLGESSGMVSICLPYGSIEPVLADMAKRDFFSYRSSAPSSKLRDLVGRGLRHAVVPVQAHLATTTLTVAELLALRTGDLIKTDVHRDEDGALVVNGQLKFRGRPGRFRHKRAFLISRATQPDEE